MKTTHQYTDTDSYIAGFPQATQRLLQEMRRAIREAAPEAQEKISYGIPTFTLGNNLVHFAAYVHHIGFYPGASGIKAFQQNLSACKSAKGSVQFPLTEPLPLELIGKIVAYRVKETKNKAKTKKK